MSVDTLTISRRRLKQIISEVVTKQNFEQLIKSLDAEVGLRISDVTHDVATDEQLVNFEIGPFADEDEAATMLAKLSHGSEFLGKSGQPNIGSLELKASTRVVEIDGEWKITGGALDFMPSGDPTLPGVTLVNRDSTHAIDKSGWNTNRPDAANAARQQQSQAARARSKGDVKKLTATVFMTPEVTAMHRHLQQHPERPRSDAEQRAEAQKWWDDVSAEVIEKQRDKMRAEGWRFTDELKKNANDAVKAEIGKLVNKVEDSGIETNAIDMEKFNDMLNAVWTEDPQDDSGIFGETPTQVSAPVSESREYVRQLINQIIIEECLSKVD
jgi:hypothetical protein